VVDRKVNGSSGGSAVKEEGALVAALQGTATGLVALEQGALGGAGLFPEVLVEEAVVAVVKQVVFVEVVIEIALAEALLNVVAEGLLLVAEALALEDLARIELRRGAEGDAEEDGCC